MSDNNKHRLNDEELDSATNDAINRKQGTASGETKHRRRPESESAGGERPRKKRPRPEGEGAGGERPRKKRPRPEGVSAGRSHGEHTAAKKSSAASAGAVRSKSSTPSKSGTKKRRRQKWTTKQKVMLAAGIIFLVLCIAGLTIYLVLHHYWSMMNHDWSGSVIDSIPEPSSIERPDLVSHDTFNVEDADEKLRKHLQENAVELMTDQDVFNVLVIGQDLRSSAIETERGNTDSMILISLNRKNKTITMTSFMRDIYLYLPDSHYSNRLNASYAHGGPQYLINTLEAYFGLKIDRYVNVTFSSFIKVVDILGGLDIYVTPEELMGKQNNNYYDGQRSYGMHSCIEAQNSVIGNPPGTDLIRISYDEEGRTLHLNGNQSLAYARLRSVGNNDFERTNRQRIVITKVIEKVRNASLSELNELANAILGEITTNITEGETFSLILDALDYAKYDIQEMRIPEEGTYSGHFIKGNSVLLCNTVKNAKDLQMLVYGKTNVDEEKLRQYEQQNKYRDDNGSLIDYYSSQPE